MEMNRVSLPLVLTIAGADSGGGAGIQADLKTFAALGTHGCSVTTCLTAQNPKRVLAIMSSTVEFLRQQLNAVFSELPPVAIKTGMLYNEELIHTTALFLKSYSIPIVVDPVMVSTSGVELLQSDAVHTLCEELFPQAALLTPNLDELSHLLGHPIQDQAALGNSARELFERYGRPVLAKGGHLRDTDQAVDILWDGTQQYVFSQPFITGVSTHGTGCTFSSAITAYLAHGLSLPDAVARAKRYINAAIEQSVKIGNYTALNWFHS